MKRPRKRHILIDAISDREPFEAPIDRYYHGANHHRAKDIGVFDVDRLVADHGETLIRSAQEFLTSASGLGRKLFWTNLIFDRGEGVFWQVTVKTNSYGSAAAFEGTYTVVVNAPTPGAAATEIKLLLEKYGTVAQEAGPAFYMLREVRGRPVRVALNGSHLMSSEDLDLHYGEGFAAWSKSFGTGLAQSGLSILRGKPGTGKTTFLRHLIETLWETHRFYYVPVESFALLSSSNFPEIWSREEQTYPNAVKVMVLEDAERLLLERAGTGDTEVSSLLNLTDGFIGDLVQVHLVCTINCAIGALDEAVLRPGRQKFFHEFKPLSYERANRLAAKLGVHLDERREYSLADIYHFKDAAQPDGELLRKNSRAIGFQAGDLPV